jgi:hypothetical protein
MDKPKNSNIPIPTVLEALANIKEMSVLQEGNEQTYKSVVSEIIKEPFKVPTPKEKVQKRPDGFDYVEHSWMDNSFKTSSPLYSNSLVWVEDKDGWINVLVQITDRITGNSELGAGASKIQVSKKTGDILDKGNNLAGALSKAIKNAHSRFGHAADVYRKLHELATVEEKERYKDLLVQVKLINPTRAHTFAEQWSQLGIDFSDYLDKWDKYVERYSSQSDKGSNVNTNQKTLI